MSNDEIPADRTFFVPSHTSDLILPADLLFSRLVINAHKPEQRVVVRDINAGLEKTAADLLSDVLNLRKVLRASLRQETLRDLDNGRETFISILAPGSYEFAVAILAVLALGAAASPFSPVMPVKEAAYYVNKAKSVAVLAATSSLTLGKGLETEIQQTTNKDFVMVPIQRYQEGTPISPDQIKISSNLYASPNAPVFVIFTSGTTGPPKAAAIRRAAITSGSFAQQVGITEEDTCLHLLPVHHATGIGVGFFPFIQIGACIEFRSGTFDPAWTWNRFRRGGATVFSGVPTIYMRLKRYWEEVILKFPRAEIDAYRKGIDDVRLCLCGTSALPQPIDTFFTSLRSGKRIVQRYGSTETGVVFNMPFSPAQNAVIPDGSVGYATMGVDVKLSEGDEGEVLLKSAGMFSKYLHDPTATRAAHDSEGYFKTGDIARKEGPYYFITGRASVDIIKSGGYKISALDIERELLSLPYIAEAMVVGVPDDEFGQKVGAVVTLRNDEMAHKFYEEHGRSAQHLDIDDMRADARDRLAGYKLPTLLRVHQGEIPKSPTGKVQKKTLGPEFFPVGKYTDDPNVQVWKNNRSGRAAKL